MKIFKLLVILISFPSIVGAEELQGKVTNVLQGDIISIQAANDKAYTIRLKEVRCDEKDRATGAVAADVSEKLVLNKSVKVLWSEKDRAGRLIGTIVYSGADGIRTLNNDLIGKGACSHYTEFSRDETLASLEQFAKDNGLGIWGEGNTKIMVVTDSGSVKSADEEARDKSSRVVSGLPEVRFGRSKIIGDKRKKKYYWKGCKASSRIRSSNRVMFNTEEDAKEAGYRQAVGCT